MIKPTVGRQVWYSPHENDSDIAHDRKQPCAATVVFVHSDRMVNLQVLDHNGRTHARTSIPLLQDGDAPSPQGGHCMWMPYQKGQAAKTEELLARSGSVRDLEDPQERARFER